MLARILEVVRTLDRNAQSAYRIHPLCLIRDPRYEGENVRLVEKLKKLKEQYRSPILIKGQKSLLLNEKKVLFRRYMVLCIFC